MSNGKAVLLSEEEAGHLGLILRNHKRALQKLNIHTRDTDRVLKALFQAFPNVAYLDPALPVGEEGLIYDVRLEDSTMPEEPLRTEGVREG
jgi:hypothetical protein